MAAGRLRALLHAQHADATRNATAQQLTVLHVVPLGECNTQQTAAEARRQRVLAMLADHPEKRYAALTDMQADREAVILTLAIRGQATCEFQIPREKWDGVLFLELLDRHSLTVH